MYIYGVLLKPT